LALQLAEPAPHVTWVVIASHGCDIGLTETMAPKSEPWCDRCVQMLAAAVRRLDPRRRSTVPDLCRPRDALSSRTSRWCRHPGEIPAQDRP
jgi:hypothetical protein